LKNISFPIILFFLTVNSAFSQAQVAERSIASKINLEKLIFHSSGSNGFTPKIDLLVDSSRSIFVEKEFYLKKKSTEKHYSGYFKGRLTENEFTKLTDLLQDCNVDTLKFPVKNCCDRIVTTLIIYYNGQRKYFRSMETPPSTDKLILYLNSLGFTKKLRKTKEIVAIEE
jgi:hypothetical protein